MTDFTESKWYNSIKYKVSYKRNYKSASTTIVNLLEPHTESNQPEYENQFTLIREPIERSRSVYKELKARRSTIKKGLQTYSEYLEYTHKHGFFDKHQEQQAFWIRNYPEIKIFKLHELDLLCDWAGIPYGNVKHLNKKNQEVTETEKDMEIIKELYKEDFELWQYLK